MANGSHILLVEGKSDEAFYTSVCAVANITATIKVAPPRLLGGNANNKEGVFQLLPALLKQLNDGTLARLAVIVDADFIAEHGLGFTRTLERFKDIVKEYGFKLVRRAGVNGIIFSHDDGLHDIGVWIMPNNKDDGMLEDWVKSSVVAAEEQLLTHAIDITGKIKNPKFKKIHKVKAEVATWLAWQASPGRGMEHSVQQQLLDHNSVQFQQLIRWLKHVFV